MVEPIKKWQGKERRSALRVEAAVKIEMLDEQQHQQFYFTRNLSSTGLFLLCDTLPAIHTALAISIALPGLRQLIPVKGYVVRHQPQEPRGVGVQFVDVPIEFTMLLEDAIKRLSSTTN